MDTQLTVYSKKVKKKPELDAIDLQVMKTVKESIGDQKGLILSIDGSHADIVNDNIRKYTGKSMAAKASTFYSPTPKPYLLNHNSEVRPVGRIYDAIFNKTAIPYKNGQTASGVLKLGVFIPQLKDDTIDLFKSGLYLDNSIGFSRETAKCSICDQDWMNLKKDKNGKPEEYCEHIPGRLYDGELCYPIIDIKEFNESSAVFGKPADYLSKIKAMANQDKQSIDLNNTIMDFDYVQKNEETNLFFGMEDINYGTSITKNIDLKGETNDMDLKEVSEKLEATLDKIVKPIQEKLSDLDTKLSNLSNGNKDEEKISTLQKELDTLKAEKTELVDKLTASTDVTTNTEKELVEIKQKLADMTAANEKLENDLKDKVTPVTKLRTNVAEKYSQI